MELLDILENLYLAPLDQNGSMFDWSLAIDSGSEHSHTCCDNSLHLHFREEVLRGGIDKYAFRKLHESPYYFDN